MITGALTLAASARRAGLATSSGWHARVMAGDTPPPTHPVAYPLGVGDGRLRATCRCHWMATVTLDRRVLVARKAREVGR